MQFLQYVNVNLEREHGMTSKYSVSKIRGGKKKRYILFFFWGESVQINSIIFKTSYKEVLLWSLNQKYDL